MHVKHLWHCTPEHGLLFQQQLEMAQSQARLSENRLSVANAENVSLAEEAQVSQVRCRFAKRIKVCNDPNAPKCAMTCVSEQFAQTCFAYRQELAESLKQQLAQRDSKLAQVNASLVSCEMERDDALQRINEKERELAQTTHALRMRIRRLEVSPCRTTLDDGVFWGR